MKREYLRGLGLEDEVIEKILSENGKDIKIEQEKIPTDYDNVKKELSKLQKQLGVDPKPGDDQNASVKQALAEAEGLKQQYLKSLSEVKVKEVFVKAGLGEEEYKNLLDTIVSDDAEASITKANNLVDLLSNKITATEKRVKEEVLKNTPAPPSGGDEGGEDLSDAAKYAEQYSTQFLQKE